MKVLKTLLNHISRVRVAASTDIDGDVDNIMAKTSDPSAGVIVV